MMFRQMPENLQYNYNQGPNSPSSSPPPNSPFQSSTISGKYFKIIYKHNYNVINIILFKNLELGSSPGPDEKAMSPVSGTQVMYQVCNKNTR